MKAISTTLRVACLTLLAGFGCDGERGVARRPRQPTHTFVCSCTCRYQSGDMTVTQTQTYDLPSAGGCGGFNETSCQMGSYTGKLRGCSKTGVESAAIAAPVSEVKPTETRTPGDPESLARG